MAEPPFAAIADPTRRAILDTLRLEGRQRAGDLAARFPQISRPAVSKHLRVLRAARLVRVEKDGRERFYWLEARHLEQAAAWLAQYETFWQDRLQALKRTAESSD